MPDSVTTPAAAGYACKHAGYGTHAAGTARCVSQAIDDPTALGPILIAPASGALIILGALTYLGRGPGKLIKAKSRRRSASRRAQRWRRRIGVALVVLGVSGLVCAFL